MKWSEDLATGIDWLDEQHQRLFQMSADYRDALDGGNGQRVYGVLLDSLSAYAAGHFRAEEHCMAEHRCPVAGNNATAHLRFEVMLLDYRRRHMQFGFRPADARGLIDAIDAWLVTHIGKIDLHLRECVKRSERS